MVKSFRYTILIRHCRVFMDIHINSSGVILTFETNLVLEFDKSILTYQTNIRYIIDLESFDKQAQQ